MADRIKFLVQKRTSLKSQITVLSNLLDRGGLDNATLKLRIARLTDLYYAFEDYNDELAMIADPNDVHQDEFLNIQERFYVLAGKIDNILYPVNTDSNSGTPSNESREVNSEIATVDKTRRIKLPEAPLPTFDGKFENWLSFKNAFRNVIDSRTDLSEIDKLHYLKSALIAEAANKTKIFDIDGINYPKAWDLLERSYEVKRILISRHISSFLNATALDKETTSGLSKLADDTQQHVASLNSLGVSISPEIIVHVLETKLPKGTLEKWEAILERNEFPTPDQIYEFLYKTAVCASKRERSKTTDSVKGTSEPPAKRKRQSVNRAFLSDVSRTCTVCEVKRHPLYLCHKFKRLPVTKRIEIVKRAKPPAGGPTTSLASISRRSTPQLLTSALVFINDHKDKRVKCRALLDTCATANFITEPTVKRLGLSVTASSSSVGAINAMSTESKGVVQIVVHSLRDGFRKNLTCMTIPAIADSIPSEVFPRCSIEIPSNITLADPEFHLPKSVDLLIGSGATLSLLSVGQINLSNAGHDLYLQKTRLGWVVAGSTSGQLSSRLTTSYLTKLDDQIAKFWAIEEIAERVSKSEEEIECETLFTETVSRNHEGRYIVRLPFRNTKTRLGNSRNNAFKRLSILERKFNHHAAFKADYTEAFTRYLQHEHISPVENPVDDGYYMPHHAVFKDSSDTTKVRIVFDASAKSSNGTSLNDILMVGPTIQSSLFAHLIRFRTYKFVIIADIEKMYLQVLVHPDDRRYQRVLWRRGNEIETFELNTLAFGVSSSPFLAIRILQQLADDEHHALPRAAEVLKTHMYVDNLLTGAESVHEVRSVRNDLIELLARGGFNLRQWAANDERIIHDLPARALHTSFSFDANGSMKTLGIIWNTNADKICYATQPIKTFERLTKRNILSEIAKIFDPLGLLGPIVFYVKKLMQDVWRSGVHWDESVPQCIFTQWSEFARQLELINQIAFNRKLLVDGYCDVQIHGFCDASNVGYGACLYIRSSKDHDVASTLLCAKSRVAPLKVVTLPRLELCGALLLARLYHEVRGTLNLTPSKIVFWSDSTIVLHWLRTSPNLLKTFVANRVAEIQETTKEGRWRHVRSNDNPADAISRGQLPYVFSRNQTWFTGPSWLIKDASHWPSEVMESIEILELKKNLCLQTTLTNREMFERFSSYSKLLRVVAYCLRWRCIREFTSSLSAKEINESEIRVLKLVQTSRFFNEIELLRSERPMNHNRLASLSPFLDENGLVRVGGRLQNSTLTFSQRHPILLPSRHHVTDCIIREIHEGYHHTGIQTTLYIMRQKFWLLDGRNQVRRIVRACIRCTRLRADTVTYKMGNLPPARVREAVPFTNTGIDFCGPFFVKEKKYRNRTRIKVYVCVFVCMSIKAVHLETVSDLTTEGFIAALRRFIARRGLPEHIYSDNGTNFVGANNQLKELYALLNSDNHRELTNKFASDHRIVWHFIPPAAPHFGGLWESTVKLFKHHLKRVVGDSLFTFEEFNTFVIEVESILNSRPITSLSSDPNDLLVLTPAHCLIGKSLTTLPEGDYTSVPANRLSTWQHIAKVRQDFWSRWNVEYLNELQKRVKWIKDGPKLDIGTVVIIKEKNRPCTQWTLGRITELHPGHDGVARAATIRVATGEIKRSTLSLCPLPVE